MSDAGLPVTKPISAWNKPLEADWKSLFKALARGGAGFALGNWEELPGAGVELVTSVGVKTSPGERAYLLIRRALTAAIHELVGESVARFRRVDDDVEDLVEGFDWSLEEAQLRIDRRFFDRPADLSIVGLLTDRLSDLLVGFGLAPARAQRVGHRLHTYFTYHLAREWREHPAAYAPLKEALEGPFAEAVEREQGWHLYDAWLQKRAAEPVFGESFSLEDIYVPLRAYWEKGERRQGDPMAADASARTELGTPPPRSGSDEQRVAVRLRGRGPTNRRPVERPGSRRSGACDRPPGGGRPAANPFPPARPTPARPALSGP